MVEKKILELEIERGNIDELTKDLSMYMLHVHFGKDNKDFVDRMAELQSSIQRMYGLSPDQFRRNYFNLCLYESYRAAYENENGREMEYIVRERKNLPK